MSEQEAPKIEFPCRYPVKVMGEHDDEFTDLILGIIRNHAPELHEDDIDFRFSKNNKYLSVKVTIIATGHEQLEALHMELKASGKVAMVL